MIRTNIAVHILRLYGEEQFFPSRQEKAAAKEGEGDWPADGEAPKQEEMAS